jgi:hypothetical protein
MTTKKTTGEENRKFNHKKMKKLSLKNITVRKKRTVIELTIEKQGLKVSLKKAINTFFFFSISISSIITMRLRGDMQSSPQNPKTNKSGGSWYPRIHEKGLLPESPQKGTEHKKILTS